MRSSVKKRSKSAGTKVSRAVPRSRKVSAAPMIRSIGDEWARHWNAGELDAVVGSYAQTQSTFRHTMRQCTAEMPFENT